MGQTLSHGVYLPAEGERNCYSGLASNWNLLDTAIGDTAGKASATHTHGNISNDGKVGTTANLPLITGTGGAVQAGVFGNQANTFCEGNDSRLSDARTPVAHTHTKSDVTDLLNSNFIPSANNTYDLGSSSYQWNNLYAQNYYYNGVAWGLDKANVWTNTNTFTAYVESIGSSTGDEYSSNARTNLWLMGNRDTEEVSGILFDTYRQNTAQGTGIHILGLSIKENSVRYEGCRWGWYWDNNLNGYTFDFKPTTQGANQALKHNLGTSADKWDTINGINPGALSLPSSSYAEIDTTNWDKTGATSQSYTPTVPGWLYISIQNIAGNYLSINSGRGAISIDGTGAQTGLRAMLPVIANESVGITVKTGAIFAARFYPMLGNV